MGKLAQGDTVMNEFAIADVLPGKLNALVKNIMLQTGETDPNKAVKLINSGKWVAAEWDRSWHRENGLIRFSVGPTDGATSDQLVSRLEARNVLSFADQGFYSGCESSKGIVTEIAVLPGTLFPHKKPRTNNFLTEVKNRGLLKPSRKIAFLIAEKFTHNEIKAMGLGYIIVMPGSIECLPDFGRHPETFSVARVPESGSLALTDLTNTLVADSLGWDREDCAFAFTVSERQL